jgi:3-oxoadipate enol-lactonase
VRLRNDPKAYAAASRAIGQFNLLGQLKRITCPTLIIVGDVDIPTPVEAAKALNQGIPGSKVKIIKDSGHNTMVEQPEQVTVAVSDFLKAPRL